MKIVRIEKMGDYQTYAYQVGQYGVVSIERFQINGLHEMFPRIRVNLDNGSSAEFDEIGLAIFLEAA